MEPPGGGEPDGSIRQRSSGGPNRSLRRNKSEPARKHILTFATPVDAARLVGLWNGSAGAVHEFCYANPQRASGLRRGQRVRKLRSLFSFHFNRFICTFRIERRSFLLNMELTGSVMVSCLLTRAFRETEYSQCAGERGRR
jgi:hypothetical protein